ncbi:hypothetical protein PHISP_07673 [Aspergillus sp. HF37]|nr:hypothetical protein PHISP_07673 [Aspergillus sp. HF37]
MNKLLKSELGFQGFVLTDWSAHQSGVGDALAGLDMSMPGDGGVTLGTPFSYFGTNLTVAVLNGTVPEWRVDDMAVRIMSAFYKVGRDHHRVPTNFDSWTYDEYGYEHAAVEEGHAKVNEFVNVRRNHATVIHDIAVASTVLLKNDGALPLTGEESTVAVLGEDATLNKWGANGCSDRGCNEGTLAMGWGSGTTNFPYLITPLEALQHEVAYKGNGDFKASTDNWNLENMARVASRASVSLVFVNADSGEGFINVDGNMGDRKNLTLWNNGDELIKTVSQNCNNTVVVMHTAGPVLVDEWSNSPNVTAVIWAGMPGQESGSAITDVLYGRSNPSGKTPFTWGKTREDYGPPLLTEPNNGIGAPQQDFGDGLIDYMYVDKKQITPVYEFGHGLSYSTFAYSDLHVRALPSGEYQPTTGMTDAAPTYGQHGNASDFLYPDGLERIPKFIYPWLNSTDLEESAAGSDYGMETSEYVPEGATSGQPQSLLPAGGAPGGNPGLYDELFSVSATIRNTGKVAGAEVPQLYVSLGGPDNAETVLREFDRINLLPGQAKRWETTLTRRDLSNWDVVSQNWVINQHPKTVHVGSSSRKLPLKATLPMNQ